MLISFAGPASGFLLAAALVLPVYCLAILYPHDYGLAFYFRVVPVVFVPNHFLTQFLQDVLQISVMWGLVNLLPIYPLDGGQIAQQVFVLSSPGDAIRQSLILSVIVGGAMIAIFLAQAMNGTESPQWQSFYPAVFFAFLTYSNFTALSPTVAVGAESFARIFPGPLLQLIQEVLQISLRMLGQHFGFIKLETSSVR